MTARRVLGTVVTLCLALSACSGSGDADFDTSLEDAVRRAAADGSLVRLPEIARFEWERFHVFGPFSDPERIQRGLGFRWGDGERRGPDYDGRQLLVFVDDGRVVRDVETGRCLPDFAHDPALERGVDRAAARFSVTALEHECYAAHLVDGEG